MSSIGHAAGKSVVAAALRADDSSSDVAEANAVEFDRACLAAGENNGAVQLPAGTLCISHLSPRMPMLMLDERHAGITIQGAGPGKTILFDPGAGGTNGQAIAIASRVANYIGAGDAIRNTDEIVNVGNIADYAQDEIIYLWVVNTLNTELRQRTQITAIDGTTITLTDTISTAFSADPGFKRVKGLYLDGQPSLGDEAVKLTVPAEISRFAVGDDAMITDGPAINELFAEWVRVTGIATDGTITFAPRLRQNYAADRACIIPPPHLTDVTIRDLAIRPSASTPTYFGAFKLANRVTFERVNFVVGSPAALYETAFNLVNIDGLVANECAFSWLAFGGCHDCVIANSTALKITGEEFSFDVQFTNVTVTGPVGFFFWTHDDPAGECRRINLTSCRILNYGANGRVFFPEDSNLTDVTIQQGSGTPVTHYMNDDGLTFINVRCSSPLRFRGEGIRLVNITAPSLTFEDDSSGVLATPLLPDPTAISDSTTAGNWRYPVTADKLGAVTIEPDNAVGLSIEAATSQTARLLEVLGLSGALFAINKDSEIVSSRITSDTSAGALIGKLKVYDPSNTPYYIRLYAS